MHNPEPVLENETHKLLKDFDIQTDHLISARRPDTQRKKVCRGEGNCRLLADYRVKLKEGKKKDKFHDLARELKKNYGR